MATLMELKGLMTDSDLYDKVQSALVISAQAILDGTPTADEQKYAAHVFSSTSSEATKALMSVLASNSASDVSAILAAPDTSIQTAVDSVIDTLSIAYNAV